MTRKPFAVFRIVNRQALAAHYEHTAERSRVDLDHLYDMARQVRNSPADTEVSRHATRADADADAARRNATTTDHVRFRAELFDI